MKKVKISMIAAMAENRVIGVKDKIPWHIREDLIRFKEKTIGHVMIMGRITFESLLGYYKRSGKPMPKRTTIIVTRDKKYGHYTSIKRLIEVYVAYSIEEAIELAKKYENEAVSVKASADQGEIFIAGGAQIFEQGIKYADRLYLTIVKGKFEGDAFFPDYSDFKKVVSKKESKNEKYEYTFLDL